MTGLKDGNVLQVEGRTEVTLNMEEGNLYPDRWEQVWNMSLIPGHNDWQRHCSALPYRGPLAAKCVRRGGAVLLNNTELATRLTKGSVFGKEHEASEGRVAARTQADGFQFPSQIWQEGAGMSLQAGRASLFSR